MGLTNLQIPAWDVLGLQMPPTFGKIRFLVANKSTDKYNAKLSEYGFPDTDVYTDLATAIAAMDTGQGDTLGIFPGSHLTTATITVNQNDVRLVGLGSPNQAYQPSTLTTGGIRLSCVTAATSEILNITGNYVQMIGLGTQNNADSGTSYCDVRVAGKNFYGSRLSLRGGNGATQLSTVGAGVPLIVDGTVAGAGNGLLIEDSIIGSSGNNARTKGPGCVEFIGSAAGTFGMHFKRCTFSTRIETATANSVGLVYLSANYAADRELLFEECGFYNFVVNLGTGPTYVIRDACGTTHQIVISRCWANKGFTSWTDVATYLSCSAPLGVLAGGIGVNS